MEEPESLLLMSTTVLEYCRALPHFLQMLLLWTRWRRVKETSSQSPLFLFGVLQYIPSGTRSLTVTEKIGLIIESGRASLHVPHPHGHSETAELPIGNTLPNHWYHFIGRQELYSLLLYNQPLPPGGDVGGPGSQD